MTNLRRNRRSRPTDSSKKLHQQNDSNERQNKYSKNQNQEFQRPHYPEPSSDRILKTLWPSLDQYNDDGLMLTLTYQKKG